MTSSYKKNGSNSIKFHTNVFVFIFMTKLNLMITIIIVFLVSVNDDSGQL